MPVFSYEKEADELLMMFFDGCRAWEMSLSQYGCDLLIFIYLIRLMYFEVQRPYEAYHTTTP